MHLKIVPSLPSFANSNQNVALGILKDLTCRVNIHIATANWSEQSVCTGLGRCRQNVVASINVIFSFFLSFFLVSLTFLPFVLGLTPPFSPQYDRTESALPLIRGWGGRVTGSHDCRHRKHDQIVLFFFVQGYFSPRRIVLGI